MLRQDFQQYFLTYSGDPVYILVNRGGSSFYVDASLYNERAEDSDILLVNRGGVSYQVSWANFDTIPRDTDIMLCNQGGLSHYLSVKTLKGMLSTSTDIIADVSDDRKTLTFSSDKSLSEFTAGLNVSQTKGGTPVTSGVTSETNIDGDWTVVQSIMRYGIVSDIVYAQGINKWVAVCSSYIDDLRKGALVSSDNGETWGKCTTPQNPSNSYEGTWRSVAWSEPLQLLVAVSDNDKMTAMSSIDGINWSNNVNLDYTVRFTQIAWGGDKFVAINNMASAAASPDSGRSFNGIDWTTRASSIDRSFLWPLLIYKEDADYFVAFGNYKSVSMGNELRIIYSQNGLDWSDTQFQPMFNDWVFSDVAYGNGRLVVTCYQRDTGELKIAYSDDLFNWYDAATDLSSIRFSTSGWAIAYGNGVFCALERKDGKAFNSRVLYSYDAVNWYSEGADVGLSTALAYQCLAHGNNRFVLAALDAWCWTGWSDTGTGTQQQLTFSDATNIENFRPGDIVDKGIVASTDEDNLHIYVKLNDPAVPYVAGEILTGPACTAATGVIASVDTANKQMVLSSSDESGTGRWLVTKPSYDPTKAINAAVTSPSL